MFGSVGIAMGNVVSQTFTTNTTWTAPAGVSLLSSVTGKGAAGAAAYTDANTSRSFQVMKVTGSASTSGGGGQSGILSWSDLWSQAQSFQSEINAGGTGSDTSAIYVQYTDSRYIQNTGTNLSWSSAIAGSASLSAISFPQSGNVTSGASASATVSFQQAGAYHSATTGASATGFGKTFPGGYSGPASVTTFSNVAVTPLTQYSIVVPTSGSITITYLKP